MPRPDAPAPSDDADDVDPGIDVATVDVGTADVATVHVADPAESSIVVLSAGEVDLAGLPLTGITRRRIAFLAAAFVTAWIVIVFARQVGEASAATTRADQMRAANVALAGEVVALERELELFQRQEYFVQQARGYRLGAPNEIAFTLAPDAPPLAPDASGSAAARLGGDVDPVTPLESWLSLLFGPER
jgi:hypothetical protein